MAGKKGFRELADRLPVQWSSHPVHWSALVAVPVLYLTPWVPADEKDCRPNQPLPDLTGLGVSSCTSLSATATTAFKWIPNPRYCV